MNKTTALESLKAMGTAQNQKVYGRHGVTGKMYGVSYANLGKLKKEIKMNHGLAVSLWSTGNARCSGSGHDDRRSAGSRQQFVGCLG